MDESDRVSDEAYLMLVNQKEGCKCAICMTVFAWTYDKLLMEIMRDMETTPSTRRSS